LNLLQIKNSQLYKESFTLEFINAAMEYMSRCQDENHLRHKFCTPNLSEITIEMIPLLSVHDEEAYKFREIIER
ncbi:11550_t:CDS:1, partial [Racocetra fulgida]